MPTIFSAGNFMYIFQGQNIYHLWIKKWRRGRSVVKIIMISYIKLLKYMLDEYIKRLCCFRDTFSTY